MNESELALLFLYWVSYEKAGTKGKTLKQVFRVEQNFLQENLCVTDSRVNATNKIKIKNLPLFRAASCPSVLFSRVGFYTHFF